MSADPNRNQQRLTRINERFKATHQITKGDWEWLVRMAGLTADMPPGLLAALHPELAGP